jgi:hypothetical protein
MALPMQVLIKAKASLANSKSVITIALKKKGDTSEENDEGNPNTSREGGMLGTTLADPLGPILEKQPC